MYLPNLPQYPVPTAQPKPQKCKRKLSGTDVSTSPPSKLPRVSGKRKKAFTRTADKEVSPPAKKTRKCTSNPDIVSFRSSTSSSGVVQHPLLQSTDNRCTAAGVPSIGFTVWMHCRWARRSSETNNICTSCTGRWQLSISFLVLCNHWF